jgi:hypothetical protein
MDADITKNVTAGLSIAPTYSQRKLQQTDGHFLTAALSQAYLESRFGAGKTTRWFLYKYNKLAGYIPE